MKEWDKSMLQMKQIPGFEKYLIDEEGTVFSVVSGKLKPRKAVRNRDGYLHLKLYTGTSEHTLKIHRLVALTFLGKSDLHVNHKDGNKENNHIANLEYVTQRENNQHKFLLRKKVFQEYIARLQSIP